MKSLYSIRYEVVLNDLGYCNHHMPFFRDIYN
jgi:hypothetical protein